VSFRKPEIAEVYDLLRRRNALIVHFSGTPKGSGKDRGEGHLFPSDLLHVINRRAMGGVSCSVVWPGDNFYGIERNATGSIGVILGFIDNQSLVTADKKDCGSIEGEGGIRIVENERDIELVDLERTFNLRTSYNEWVVRDYKVRGVFAASPFEVSILKIPVYPSDMPDYLRDNTPVPDLREVGRAELLDTFRGLPIYTFDDKDILQFSDNVQVAHSHIYFRNCGN
jgi:hypothetical protein